MVPSRLDAVSRSVQGFHISLAGPSTMRKSDRARAIGLAVAALAIGLAYLFGGFVPQHEWVIAPAALLCVAGAFWCGLRRSSVVSPLGRLKTATAWALAIVVVLALPAGVRWTWLQRELRTVPISADAYDVRRETNVVFWRNSYPGPYSVKYASRLSFDEADRFLTEGFTANGWKVGGRFRVETYAAADGISQALAERFNRQPQAGQFRHYTMIRSNRWMNVFLFDAGNERWILCETHGEPPPDSLRRFWR